MNNKILTLFLLLSLTAPNTVFGRPVTNGGADLNATICGKCHQGESNMMLGFLKGVSYKAGTILMDLLTHKEVVYFDDDTRVKNLNSLEDMKNYRGKGFRIYFAEEDGRKEAVHITRFDILQLVDDQDKLSIKDVESLLADSSKKVVLVDVRPRPHYLAGHIEGAVNVPAPAFDKFKKNLPAAKDTTLVVYGVGGCLSPSVAVNAMALGYDDVKIYTSGFPEWSKKHYGVAEIPYVRKGLKGHSLVLLDLRERKVAEKGHLPGAFNADFRDFAKVKESLPADRKAPIVLYGADAPKAADILRGWGYGRVRILAGGVAAWQKAAGELARGPLAERITYIPKVVPGVISASEFAKIVSDPAKTQIIDVRDTAEFAAGHIVGSVNIPADEIEESLAKIDHNRDTVVFCNSGVRAEMAYNILKNKGYKVRYLNAILHIDGDGKYKIEEQ